MFKHCLRNQNNWRKKTLKRPLLVQTPATVVPTTVVTVPALAAALTAPTLAAAVLATWDILEKCSTNACRNKS